MQKIPASLRKELDNLVRAKGIGWNQAVAILLLAGGRIVDRCGGLCQTEAILSQQRRVGNWGDFFRLDPLPGKGKAVDVNAKTETELSGA